MRSKRFKATVLLAPTLVLSLLTAAPARATGATIEVAPATMALGSSTLPALSGTATADTGYTLVGGVTCTAPGVSAASEAGDYTITCSQGWTQDGTDPVVSGTATGTGTLTVQTANLTITGVTVAVHTYDGTTDAQITSCTYAGDVALHTPSCSGTGVFNGAGIGPHSVTVTDVSITSHTSDYVVSPTIPTSATGSIDPRHITATISNAKADPKVYDGTKAAAGTSYDCAVSYVASGDSITCNGSAVEFSDANVGTGKSLRVSGLSISGTGSGNYVLDNTSATSDGSTGDITAKDVTVGTVTVASREYNGGTDASISGCTLTGLVGTDTSSCGGTAAFLTASVGTGKTINVTVDSVTNSNYKLASGSTSTTSTANITAKTLIGSVDITGTKIYDGTTAPPPDLSITGCDVSAGVIGSDQVSCSVSGAAATYATKAAGSNKTMVVTGVSLTGADAGNYQLSTSFSSSASITPRDTTVSLSATSRPYNGSTSATVPCTASGLISGDSISCVATLTAASVGSYTVDGSSVSLAGTDGGNYNVTSMNSTTVTVTQAKLVPTVVIADKVYDGGRSAQIIDCVFNSAVATADGVYCDYSRASATFSDASIGANILVTITGLSMGGGAATSNFTAPTTAKAYASITNSAGGTNLLPLTVSAVDTIAYTGLPLPPLQFRVSENNILTYLPTCTAYNGTTPITSADVEGVFTIKCAGAVAPASYAITYVDAKLTVVPDDGTHGGIAPLATFAKPIMERVPATAGMLIRAQLFAADGRLLTVSVSVPKGAYPTDLNIEFSPARALPDLLGYTSVKLTAYELNGKEVTRFNKPLVLTIPAGAVGVIPAWSIDGEEWTPIPKLTSAALPTGAADGYFIMSDGSIQIFTTHFTTFALQTTQAALTVKTKVKAKFWQANKKVALTYRGGSGAGAISYVSLSKKVCNFAKPSVGSLTTKKTGRCIVIVKKAGNRQFFDAESAPLVLAIKTSAGAALIDSTKAGITTGTGTWRKLVTLPSVLLFSGVTLSSAFHANLGSSATKTLAVSLGQPIIFTLTGLGKGATVSPMIIGPSGVGAYLTTLTASKTGGVQIKGLKFSQSGTYRLLVRLSTSGSARLFTLRVV